MSTRVSPYRVSRENSEVVIRVPEDLISTDDLTRFLDYLVVKQGSREFAVGQEQIAALADEIDAAAWERLRPMVEEKRRGNRARGGRHEHRVLRPARRR